MLTKEDGNKGLNFLTPKIFKAVENRVSENSGAVSYTHLRAHETVLDLVCRLLLEKKQTHMTNSHNQHNTTTHNTPTTTS